MPENFYPQLPTVPPISQESFNIEMVRKYYQDIANLTEKQRKYKNAYNRLLHASTSVSSVAAVVAFQLLECQSPLWNFL